MRPEIHQKIAEFDAKINTAMGNPALSPDDRQRLLDQRQELDQIMETHLNRMKDVEDSLTSEIDRLSRNVDYMVERMPTAPA